MKTASIYHGNQADTCAVWREAGHAFCKAFGALSRRLCESTDAAATIASVLLTGALIGFAFNRMAEATSITSSYSESILQSAAALWRTIIIF